MKATLMLHLRNHCIASVFFILTGFIALSAHATDQTSTEESDTQEQTWRISWIDPKPIEAFELIGEQEKTVLAAFKGKVILMNFWALWCPPCVKELPSMAQLQHDYGAQGLQVIAVAQDPKGFERLLPYWREHHLEILPLFWDERSKLMYNFSISGLPTTLIFDRNGTLRGKIEGGADWQSEYFQKFVAERLLTLP